MADELIVHKDGKTRRATDEAHRDRLVAAGWKKGRPSKTEQKKAADTGS